STSRSACGADGAHQPTHGRPTRSSGRPPRRRRPTTSRASRRSAAAGRCATFAGACLPRPSTPEPPKAMKGFRALSVAAAVATYALVVLGGVVRVSGSGLGCPDWPLCHGRLLPPLNLHAIIEYSHRTTASLASALIVLTAAVALLAWRKRRDIVIPALVAFGLLVAQVVLGAI